MNIIQAVKYMMRVLIPQITPIAGEGIEVAKEKEGSVISATFPGWLPHDEVYVGNSTNAAWAAGTVVMVTAGGVADPEEYTLAATIPAAGADGQFAVVADAIAAGDDGLAAVTGLAVAKMSAGYTEAFAAPDGLGGLAGAASGPFRVIYANSTAGEALVAFAGGGGGGTPADGGDQFSDQFRVSFDGTSVNVSGGVVVNGDTQISCSGASFSPASTGSTRYVILAVSYNRSASSYSASLSYSSSISYPTSNTSYIITLASFETVAVGEVVIRYYHAPSPVYITGRWS